MTQPNPEIPQYITEADLVETFLNLQPPVNDAELDELGWYSENYGRDGVLATLGTFAAHRSSVIDPSYPLIAMSFNPDVAVFADEELTEIGTVTKDMREDFDKEWQISRERFDLWRKEGIINPTVAHQRVEEVRKLQGNEAADICEIKLFGPRLTDEEWARKRAKDLDYSRKVAADMQRARQALSPREQRQGAARVRMTLYHLARGTGPFAEMDDE